MARAREVATAIRDACDAETFVRFINTLQTARNMRAQGLWSRDATTVVRIRLRALLDPFPDARRALALYLADLAPAFSSSTE